MFHTSHNSFARTLTIALCLLLVLPYFSFGRVSDRTVHAADSEETLPFTFTDTDYGVVNEDVIAKKITITDTNASFIDDHGLGCLMIQKKSSDSSDKVTYYLVGKNGLVRTFEGTESNRATFSRLVTEEYLEYYPDCLFSVKNPETGKWDIYNVTSDTYYEIGADCFRVADYSAYIDDYHDRGLIMYEQDSMQGLLRSDGSVLSDAIYTSIDQDVNCMICYDDTDDNGRYDLWREEMTQPLSCDEYLSDYDIGVYAIQSDDQWAYVNYETLEIITEFVYSSSTEIESEIYQYNGEYYIFNEEEDHLITKDGVLEPSLNYVEAGARWSSVWGNDDLFHTIQIVNYYYDEEGETVWEKAIWLSPDGSEVYARETFYDGSANYIDYYRNIRVLQDEDGIVVTQNGVNVMGGTFDKIKVNGKYLIGTIETEIDEEDEEETEKQYTFYNYIDGTLVTQNVSYFNDGMIINGRTDSDDVAVVKQEGDPNHFGLIDLGSGTVRFSGYIYDIQGFNGYGYPYVNRTHRFENNDWVAQITLHETSETTGFEYVVNSDFEIIDEGFVLQDVRTGDTLRIVTREGYVDTWNNHYPSPSNGVHILDFNGKMIFNRTDAYLLDCTNQGPDYLPYRDAYVTMMSDDERSYYGLVAPNNTEILPCTYSFVGNLRNGVSYFENGSGANTSNESAQAGIVDARGNMIIQGMFSLLTNDNWHEPTLYRERANMYPFLTLKQPDFPYYEDTIYLYDYSLAAGSGDQEKEYQKEAKELALQSAVYRYGIPGSEMEVDVLTKAHSIEPDHNDFDLICRSKSETGVGKYLLYSGTKLVAQSSNGRFIGLKAAQFDPGKRTFVIVKGTKGSMKTPLYLEVKDKNIAVPESTTLLGSGFSLTLNENIPLVGGREVSFDLPASFPVEAVIEDGKLKIGVNIAKENLYSSNSYDGNTTSDYHAKSIAKQMESWRKDAYKSSMILKDMQGYLKQANLAADIPFMEKGAKVSLMGYFETEWSDRVESVSGTLILILSGSVTFQGQTVIVFVPATANIKASASASIGGSVKYNFTSDPTWEADLSSRISVSLEPYAGIGIGQYATIGFYGSMTGGVDITWMSLDPKEKTGPTSFYMQGEVGGKAYFAMQEFKARLFSLEDLKNNETIGPYISGDKLLIWSRDGGSLLHETKPGTEPLTEMQRRLFRDPDAFFEPAAIQTSKQLRTTNDEGALVAEAYPGAMPQLAEVDGMTVLAYIDIDSDRPEADQTVLKYAVYDPETGRFSSAKIVEDDGTADMQPAFFTSNGTLYLYWQNSREAFAEGETPDLNTYAKTFGITAAKFDADTQTFVPIGAPDRGENYCYLPTLAETEQGLACIWAENTDGNIFGATGENSIYRAVLTGDTWSAPETVQENAGCLTAIAAGKLGAVDTVAYVVDPDNDLTTGEKDLYLGNTRIDSGMISNPAFAQVDGQAQLLYSRAGALAAVTEASAEAQLLTPEGTMDLYSPIVVQDQKVYYLKTFENSRNVYSLEKGAEAWNSVPITQEEAYVDSFSLAGTRLSCLVSDVDLSTEDLTSVSSIKFTEDFTRSDLVLDAAVFDHEELAQGNELNVRLVFTNNGTEPAETFEAVLARKSSGEVIQTVPMDVQLAPGESADEVVTFTLPDDYDATAYTVSVKEPGTSAENEFDIDLGKADLVVETAYAIREDGRYLDIAVSNTGMAAAESTTVVTDSEGRTLQTYTDAIPAGETKTYTYNVDAADIDLSGEGSVLTVYCTADTEEYYESNNTVEIRVWDVEAETPEAISNRKAAIVEQMIMALPDPDDVTDDDYDDVIEAREQYDSLSDDQKLLVSQEALEKLIALEEKLDIKPPSRDVSDYEFIVVRRMTYTGSPLCPRAFSYELEENEDFEVSYEDNINVGTGKVIVRGIGAYTGVATYYFTIDPADIALRSMSLQKTSYTYTGKAIKATVVAPGLKKDVDYTLAYKNHKKAGTAKVTVTGIGNYTGSQVLTYKINPKALKAGEIKLKTTSYTYNGSAKKPAAVVKSGDVTLVKSTDYTITYTKNKSVGTATATIKGKGNYKGTIKKTFKIKPKATTISKLTAGSKRFTVKWKKQAAQTTGYQIQYSTSSTFKSGNKTATVKKNTTTSKVIKSLKAKKKYYVRIRTYKTVSGKKYYSAWSAKKSITTKK